MSTDYGFYCLDCKDPLIIENCRGGCIGALERLIVRAVELGKLYNDFKDYELVFKIEYSLTIDLSFLFIHSGHKLCVIDEYGGRDPSCEIDHKVSGVYCKLVNSHDGKCSDIGVFER